MKNKDLEKLLNQEGKVMFASSFDGVKNKLQASDKYLNRTPIKEKKIRLPKITFASKLTIGLSSVAVAGIVCAVILPISMNNSNLAPKNNALCDVEINDPINDAVVKLAYDVNTKGLVNSSSVYAKNEMAKKVLSAMKKDKFRPLSNRVDEFTISLINYIYNAKDIDGSSLMNADSDNFCVIRIKGPGANDKTFNTKFADKLTAAFDRDFQNKSFTATVIADASTYGSLIDDMLLARKSELYYFIEKLFGNNNYIIEGFEPNEEFLQTASLEQIENCLSKLQNIYNHIPLDDYLNDFRTNLESIETIFETRRLDLFAAKETFDAAAKKTWGTNNLNDFESLKCDFDELKLPSPFWWNTTINENIDLNDLMNIQFPTESITFAEHILSQSKTYTKEDKEISKDIIKSYNDCCELIEKNQLFFAKAFDFIKDYKMIEKLKTSYSTGPDLKTQLLNWSLKQIWDQDEVYWNNYWKK